MQQGSRQECTKENQHETRPDCTHKSSQVLSVERCQEKQGIILESMEYMLPGTTQRNMEKVAQNYRDLGIFRVPIFSCKQFSSWKIFISVYRLRKFFNNEKFSRARITVDLASHTYGTSNQLSQPKPVQFVLQL